LDEWLSKLKFEIMNYEGVLNQYYIAWDQYNNDQKELMNYTGSNKNVLFELYKKASFSTYKIEILIDLISKLKIPDNVYLT